MITLFCSHDYVLINQITTESEFDQLIKAGKNPNTHTSFTRYLITDYKCSKCGKLKRLKVKV